MLSRKLWLKLALVTGLPLLLYVGIAERMSWRPRTLAVGGRLTSLVFSPDSKLLFAAGGKAFPLWDVRTGTSLEGTIAVPTHASSTQSKPNGKALCQAIKQGLSLYAEHNAGLNHLQDIPTLSLLWDHQATIGAETAFLSHDARFLVFTKSRHRNDAEFPSGVAGNDVALELWDVPHSKPLHTLKPKAEPVTHISGLDTVSISPDNKIIASVFDFALDDWFSASIMPMYVHLQLWNAQTGQPLPTTAKINSAIPDDSSLDCLTFSPTNQLLAVEAHDQIALINPRRATVRFLSGHTNKVTALAFSPDGKQLVSGSQDCNLRVWNVSTGRCERILRGHKQPTETHRLAFSPDGSTLASSDYDGNVNLWRMK